MQPVNHMKHRYALYSNMQGLKVSKEPVKNIRS